MTRDYLYALTIQTCCQNIQFYFGGGGGCTYRQNICSCRNVAIRNLRSCFCGAPSLRREQVCSLQCNNSMVRVAQNPSLSHLRLPQPRGPGSLFISPRSRVAQLYPQALGSLYVASYDSQGCGESIITCPHTGNL
jgi:hypothetical protein